MKVLVVGSGGREHAICWKLKHSQVVKQIYCAPGNAGIGLIAQTVNIKVDDINGLINFVKKNRIDLTVVGPELPLTLGIVDEFRKRKLRIFGPTKAAAELEGQRIYAEISYSDRAVSSFHRNIGGNFICQNSRDADCYQSRWSCRGQGCHSRQEL